MEGDCEGCIAAGMDDYVSKLIKPQALDQALAAAQSPSARDQPTVAPVPPSLAFDLPGYLDGVKTAIEQNDNEGIAHTKNIGGASTCFGTLGKELAKLEPLLIELSGDKSLAEDADCANGASQA